MTGMGELIVAATCGAICVFSIAVGAVCWFVLRVSDAHIRPLFRGNK